MPARNTSAFVVAWLCIFRPTIHIVVLMWLMDSSNLKNNGIFWNSDKSGIVTENNVDSEMARTISSSEMRWT